MIPNLALVVAAYISFRMIEVFLSPASRYSSQRGRVAACIFATLILIGTSLCALDILLGASTGPILR
ncbi:MAG TPA: hypothetical protein VNO32_49540 [Candidatus Acidoferrum sp.]|jgi:hypothetical protein|nr:hypothetical protein [Candidatus Acidoferrum sp.]